MSTQRPVRIIRERHYTSTPFPGEVRKMVAVTYQVPPLPPQVVFLEDVKRSDQELRAELLKHADSRQSRPPRNV